MLLTVQTEVEDDGRWIPEVVELRGVMVYGSTQDEAVSAAQALALRDIADRIEHGEVAPGALSVPFLAA